MQEEVILLFMTSAAQFLWYADTLECQEVFRWMMKMNLIAQKHLQSSNYIPAVKKPADIKTPESTLIG